MSASPPPLAARQTKALVYVQHLLGIGHLVRAGVLARALEAAGVRVTLVSGGMPVPTLDLCLGRFEQLPPARAADDRFETLLDEHDRPVDDAWRAARRDRLIALFEAERPDIVVIEMYPFGRRQMRFEIEALLERARSNGPDRPLIVSSVRDILVPSSRPERLDEMVARVRRFFDLVLIHGDPAFIPFERTFPRFQDIASVARHTGYVASAPPPRDDGPGRGEVVVSAGGGAASDRILGPVIESRALGPLDRAPWRVLVGYGYPEERFRAVQDAAPPGVIVERARADFRRLLANCRLSISQGGYNTVVEVLASRAPAVCLPFAEAHASVQAIRCRLLAERGAIQTVEPEKISAASVAAAVARALETRAACIPAIDTRGAERSVELLMEALDERHMAR